MAQKPVKVAFIGTHGIGKTTLVYDQAARFKREGVNVEIVAEVARGCPLPINQATTLDAQTWILMSQIAAEIKAAHTGKLVICDRAVLDNYAYLHRACVGSTRDWELESWLIKWVQTYDLLIKVPFVASKLEADGVRDTDVQFAAEIDSLIDSLYHTFAVREWRWLSKNRESWGADAYRIIKEELL